VNELRVNADRKADAHAENFRPGLDQTTDPGRDVVSLILQKDLTREWNANKLINNEKL
jgi:hypothetical protein